MQPMCARCTALLWMIRRLNRQGDLWYVKPTCDGLPKDFNICLAYLKSKDAMAMERGVLQSREDQDDGHHELSNPVSIWDKNLNAETRSSRTTGVI